MKTRLFTLCLLAFAAVGCTKDIVHSDSSTERVMTRAGEMDGTFYYYGYEDIKIFVNEVPDKMYVKYASESKQSQIVSASEVALLKPAEIVSATPLMEYQGSEFAITDEFVVKLKPETSYADLQKLAEENGCSIGKENEFVKGQYMLSVPTSSELNPMKMANRFYETGLFEFSEPNIIDFDAENSLDTFFQDQWGLKNIGQSGGTSSIDINVEAAWNITKGSPNIRIAVIDSGVHNG